MPLEPAYRQLAGLLVGGAVTLPVDEAGWLQLVALACSERVGPLLDRVLCVNPGLDTPDASRQLLEKLYRTSLHASLRHAAVRRRVCLKLAERSIPVMVLKGAALAPMFYENPATRLMGDVDLLVPQTRIEEAARCLEENGFRFASGSLTSELRSPRGHVICLDSVTAGTVELHWVIKGLGPGHAAALAEIWAGAQPAGFESDALVMRTGHMIPHLCAHLTIQHKRAWLQGLFDLHRVLLSTSADEAVVVTEAATRWGLAPCVSRTLHRVQQLFGSPLIGPLAAWVEGAAAQDGLQARIAALALAPGAPDMPHAEMVGLALGDGDQTLMQFLFPSLSRIRQRLGRAPDDPISAGTYARFMAMRLRRSPSYLRHYWEFWRAARQPHRRSDEMLHQATDTAP